MATDPAGTGLGQQWAAGPTWAVALILFVIAVVPRVQDLGRLSLYADEDITALTASAVLDGRGPTLPSGMEYRRAAPLTWLSAASAAAIGERSELAFRLPAALLGALSVPALFLLGRRWIGLGGALTAALLLGFSEWHLVFSRQARMYAPLLLFVILGTWGLWTWARDGGWKPLAAGLLCSAVATLLHKLGVLVAAAPLVWLGFEGVLAVPRLAVVAVAAAIAVFGLAIDGLWVAAPYRSLGQPPPRIAANTSSIADAGSAATAPGGFAWWDVLLIAVGLVLAWHLYRRVRVALDPETHPVQRLGFVSLALAAGAAAGSGQLYGFALAGALFLLLGRRGVAPLLREAPWATAGLVGLLAARSAFAAVSIGPGPALERAAAFPYPHALTLLLQAPMATLLFGLTCLRLVLVGYDRRLYGLAAAAALTIGTIAAIGVARVAGPTRYLLPAYPFMLLVAGGGLYLAVARALETVSGRARRRARWIVEAAVATSTLIAVSGLIPDHGVGVAARLVDLEHGADVNSLIHMFPFRPDHRSVGRFVAAARREGDVVVAEDPIVQGWYTGSIDHWFRRYEDMRRYLRRDRDGTLRDIYVGSRSLEDPRRLDSLSAATPGRVWLLTSGETAPLPTYYLSPDQSTWLDSLRRTRRPVHVGSDGASAVYCLNCAPGTTEPARP